MQTYDLVIVGILVAATLFGAYKGLAWQIASIASLFVSYFAAFSFRNDVASYITAAPPWNMFAAMLGVYLFSSAGIWLAFQLVAGFIDRLKLKEFDRQVGALLGFAKGVLLSVVVTLFAISLSSDTQRRSIVESRSGYYLALLLHKAHDVMPPELHSVLDPYLQPLGAGLHAPVANTPPQPAPAPPEPSYYGWPGQGGAAPVSPGPAPGGPAPGGPAGYAGEYVYPVPAAPNPPPQTPREHIARPLWEIPR